MTPDVRTTTNEPAHLHFLDGAGAGQEVSMPVHTVLLAEDNDDLRFVLKATLQMLGYRVVACADAEIASVAFRLDREINVLLTDFEMPGRSGVDLARELTTQRPSLPVMLYTGSLLSAELLQEIRERHWEYVSKPATVAVLDSTLKRLLRTRLLKAA